MMKIQRECGATNAHTYYHFKSTDDFALSVDFVLFTIHYIYSPFHLQFFVRYVVRTSVSEEKMSRYFTLFVRFFAKNGAWKRARGGSSGKNAIFRTPLHGSFIGAYVQGCFCGDTFGGATPAFKREKRAPRDDFFAIFFGILSLLAKTKALLVEIIPLSVEIMSLSVRPMFH